MGLRGERGIVSLRYVAPKVYRGMWVAGRTPADVAVTVLIVPDFFSLFVYKG